MSILYAGLITATALCSAVAGFLLAFAVVAMPGLGTLGDREFLRAFQVIDRVIQNQQPIFMILWVGSVAALGFSGLWGAIKLQGLDRLLLLAATAVYFLGVQLPTVKVNVPLNNQLKAVDLGTLSAPDLAETRARFEPRWNRWNHVRTILASLCSVLLILLLFRI